MINKLLFITLFLSFSALAKATASFDTWNTNAGISGNYIITVSEQATDGVVDFNLTVDPWNAEALGVFFDLGNYTVPGSTLITFTDPLGEVVLFATDTTSNSCGPGCTLNGLNPVLIDPDEEWELVFRLAGSGYDGIQSFSWTVAGLTGFEEGNIGVVGVRAQVLCSGTDLLPAEKSACSGSDKSVNGIGNIPPSAVPEPSIIALFGMGLLGMGVSQLRKKAKAF